MMTTDLHRLKRLGWAVRAVFTLGIAASLAGNVLHAENNAISQAIAAWSPLALLLAVELISRVPLRRGAHAVARLAATAVIAGIAAWVSYWHLVGVAVRYGESGASPYLIPFSVDGLIVIASVSLVEIGGRIRRIQAPADPATPVAVPNAAPAVKPLPAPQPAAEPAPVPPGKKAPVKRVKPRPASADKVAKVAAKMPGAPVAAIAEKAGVSPSTARRHLAALAATDASPSAPAPAETPALAAA
ncbi:DUF2637 domain-containing protein [Pseudosporangium ferrugineum]|uniref:Uncharacterized protein DUF2637 n=1 Tax=Pseudosporangium ferrugineum TaxID=439699 RepID=A0A2T0RD96_9ACTN|nr:DUF2637 domain-containing protein [Pseudosporangium ferrugineum]PRY19132.1 uncharacterized protein DUF2637 [Pseudosporangium ferrugineum]